MRKKRIVGTLMFTAFILLLSLNFYLLGIAVPQTFSNPFFSGFATTTGSVTFAITSDLDFTIVNPEDQTIYYFSAGQGIFNNGAYEFPLSLLIQTYSNITDWNYSLNNTDYGEYYSDVDFSPNITIYARVGSNNLSVAAGNTVDTLVKSIDFTVEVQNASPEIMFNNSTYLYACEDQTFLWLFNITDLDNSAPQSVVLSPQNPFYAQYLGRIQPTIFSARITSLGFTLDDTDIGIYNETLTVSDIFYTDIETFAIEVLDVNTRPTTSNLSSELIWNNGNSTNFYYNWSASDLNEDGQLEDSIMNVTLTYQNGSAFTLFNITSDGIMNFTADNSTELTTHYLSVCVNDTGLTNPHQNLSLHCNETGLQNTVCDNFTLTITDSNRAPVITETYTNTTARSINALEPIRFNMTGYDYDDNPVDVEWYVAGVLAHRNTYPANNITYTYNDSFTYTFPCGAGTRNVLVNFTDGSLYDSFEWTVSVTDTESCSGGDSGGGGGGGGGGGDSVFCVQNWFCPDFNVCLNARSHFESGSLDIFSYNTYVDQCTQLGYEDSVCGFQLRSCVDLNNCTENVIETPKPGVEDQICFYVKNAGCSDGVKNCHDGSCETRVDCGGPCDPCPTCSDGVFNQDEEGIDCGGPCTKRCEYEEPEGGWNTLIVLLLIGILLLIIFIIYILHRWYILFFGKKDRDNEDKKMKKMISKGSVVGSRQRRIREMMGLKNDDSKEEQS